MKRTCLSVCVLISVASDLFATQLGNVLAHSEKFENHRITVVGIARVPGYFYLCPDEKAAAEKNPWKALLVRKDNSRQPEYRELDRQWVEVTGVMSDKDGRGYEMGPMLKGHGILLEHIRVLRDRPKPRIKDDTVWGIFKNSTAEPLGVEIIPKSEGGALFYMKPGDVEQIELSEGRAVALRVTGPKNLRLYERGKDMPVASGEITFRSLPSNYEYSDEPSEKRRLYLKIADHQIKRVEVSEGRSWKRQ